MQAAAQTNLKKVSLELGGKSPAIIFPDADLDVAINACTLGIFFNQGQCCCASSRLLIHEDIYDKFVEVFTEKAKSWAVGDPLEATSMHGPLVDEIQYKRVLSYMEAGKAEGACAAVGGERIDRPGYFVKPTLFTNVTDDMKIATEEIFGPVTCAFKFKTIEEAIERANKTNYGLAAAVFTRDLKTSIRVQNALQAGTVWVNTYNAFFAAAPFGGFSQSGIGRELGEYGLHEYTQVKTVTTAL